MKVKSRAFDATSASWHEEGGDRCRVVVNGRQDVRVGLQSDRNVRVAEAFLNDTAVDAGLQTGAIVAHVCRNPFSGIVGSLCRISARLKA
jgi:hypothetical protein